MYPTGIACDKLEKLVETARIEAAGWAYADCCRTLDDGDNLQKIEILRALARAKENLGGEKGGLDSSQQVPKSFLNKKDKS